MGTVTGAAIATIMGVLGPITPLIYFGVGAGSTVAGAAFSATTASIRRISYGALFGLTSALAITGISDIAQSQGYKDASTAEVRSFETEMDKVITRQANGGNLYHSVMNEKGRYVTLEEYRN